MKCPNLRVDFSALCTKTPICFQSRRIFGTYSDCEMSLQARGLSNLLNLGHGRSGSPLDRGLIESDFGTRETTLTGQ